MTVALCSAVVVEGTTLWTVVTGNERPLVNGGVEAPLTYPAGHHHLLGAGLAGNR